MININTSQPLPFEIKRWDEKLDFPTDHFFLTLQELLSTPQEISFGCWTEIAKHILCSNTIPNNSCKSQNSHMGPDLGFKRGWTSPNKWYVPASRNLCGVQEQFSDSCAVSLYSLWYKNMGQREQIPKREWEGISESWCVSWEEGDPLTFVVLCHCRSWGFAAISGGHHVPHSQGSGSVMGWDCGFRAVCPLGQLLLPAKKKRECQIREILAV